MSSTPLKTQTASTDYDGRNVVHIYTPFTLNIDKHYDYLREGPVKTFGYTLFHGFAYIILRPLMRLYGVRFEGADRMCDFRRKQRKDVVEDSQNADRIQSCREQYVCFQKRAGHPDTEETQQYIRLSLSSAGSPEVLRKGLERIRDVMLLSCTL